MKYLPAVIGIIVLAGLGYLASIYGPTTPPEISNSHPTPTASTDSNPASSEFSELPSPYETYTNDKYGFAFDYHLPSGRYVLDCSDGRPENTMVFNCAVMVPDTDIPGGIRFWVMRERNLHTELEKTREQLERYKEEFGEPFTETKKTVNGIEVTIFRYHEQFGDSDMEVRMGKLASGWVFWAQADETDQRFLDSIKNI